MNEMRHETDGAGREIVDSVRLLASGQQEVVGNTVRKSCGRGSFIGPLPTVGIWAGDNHRFFSAFWSLLMDNVDADRIAEQLQFPRDFFDPSDPRPD